MASTTRIASFSSTFAHAVRQRRVTTSAPRRRAVSTGHSSRTSRRYAATVVHEQTVRNCLCAAGVTRESKSKVRAATRASVRALGSCSVPAWRQHHASHASAASGPAARWDDAERGDGFVHVDGFVRQEKHGFSDRVTTHLPVSRDRALLRRVRDARVQRAVHEPQSIGGVAPRKERDFAVALVPRRGIAVRSQVRSVRSVRRHEIAIVRSSRRATVGRDRGGFLRRGEVHRAHVVLGRRGDDRARALFAGNRRAKSEKRTIRGGSGRGARVTGGGPARNRGGLRGERVGGERVHRRRGEGVPGVHTEGARIEVREIFSRRSSKSANPRNRWIRRVNAKSARCRMMMRRARTAKRERARALWPARHPAAPSWSWMVSTCRRRAPPLFPRPRPRGWRRGPRAAYTATRTTGHHARLSRWDEHAKRLRGMISALRKHDPASFASAPALPATDEAMRALVAPTVERALARRRAMTAKGESAPSSSPPPPPPRESMVVVAVSPTARGAWRVGAYACAFDAAAKLPPATCVVVPHSKRAWPSVKDTAWPSLRRALVERTLAFETSSPSPTEPLDEILLSGADGDALTEGGVTNFFVVVEETKRRGSSAAGARTSDVFVQTAPVSECRRGSAAPPLSRRARSPCAWWKRRRGSPRTAPSVGRCGKGVPDQRRARGSRRARDSVSVFRKRERRENARGVVRPGTRRRRRDDSARGALRDDARDVGQTCVLHTFEHKAFKN